MEKKLTKKQEKSAINLIGKVVGDISKIIQKDRDAFISEMVDAMILTADVMARGKQKGLNVNELMPEITKAYNEKTKDNN